MVNRHNMLVFKILFVLSVCLQFQVFRRGIQTEALIHVAAHVKEQYHGSIEKAQGIVPRFICIGFSFYVPVKSAEKSNQKPLVHKVVIIPNRYFGRYCDSDVDIL